MIIQLEGADSQNVQAAKRSLQAMARGWDHEITEAETTAAAGTRHDDHDKVIDPVALAALVLSIPSAATAVLDLADRIGKRRRAKELIDHAKQLADQQVAVRVISRSRTIELSTMTPDQLLDLLADEDTPSLPQATGDLPPAVTLGRAFSKTRQTLRASAADAQPGSETPTDHMTLLWAAVGRQRCA
jgi:hypothetical protein